MNQLELLDIIYGAPLDEHNWHRLMEAIRKQFPFSFSALAFYDQKFNFINTNTLGDFTQDLDLYERHFVSVNPWIKVNQSTPIGATLRSSDFIPTANFRKSEFFNDWLRSYDNIDEGIGSVVVRKEDCLALLGLHYRSDKTDDADIDELKRFVGFVTPHLQRAILLRRKLEGLQSYTDQLEGALDTLQNAFFVVDETCAVRFANKPAQHLQNVGDPVRMLPGGRLGLRHEMDQQSLQARIREATGVGLATAAGFGKTALRVNAEPAPMSVIVCPLSKDLGNSDMIRVSTFETKRYALVCISTPENLAHVPESIVATALGISPAEARLAVAVYQGWGVSEHADNVGLSRSTARNQMQSILQKTGAGKQVELVRMLATVIGGLEFPES